MSLSSIEGRMASVSLAKDEPVVVADVRGLLAASLTTHVLAAKVLSPRVARIDNLLSAFKAAWKDQFKFQIKQGDQVSSMAFNAVDFWVHILDLPLGWASTQVSEALGKALGLVKRVICDGLSMKIRVEMDITRPLKKSISTVNTDSTTLFLAVRYEKMPDFCYKCGMVTHVEKECMLTDEGRFGSWLRTRQIVSDGEGWGMLGEQRPARVQVPPPPMSARSATVVTEQTLVLTTPSLIDIPVTEGALVPTEILSNPPPTQNSFVFNVGKGNELVPITVSLPKNGRQRGRPQGGGKGRGTVSVNGTEEGGMPIGKNGEVIHKRACVGDLKDPQE